MGGKYSTDIVGADNSGRLLAEVCTEAKKQLISLSVIAGETTKLHLK
jgi:hypothetical protein